MGNLFFFHQTVLKQDLEKIVSWDQNQAKMTITGKTEH